MIIDATVAGTGKAMGADGHGLGIEYAKLFIKILCDLARQLNEVATVKFSICPVEPAQKNAI